MIIDKEDSSLFEEQQNSDILLVIFGGIRQEMGIPKFEFKRVLSEIPCNKLFLRDKKQSWYHNGISTNIDNIELLQKFLSDEINTNNYKKVVFIGNSMGGYAAILFGTLLEVSNIIVFSPQTFIDKWNRFFYKDNRWSQEINRVYNSKSPKKDAYDLKKVLNKNKDTKVRTSIYYSKGHKLDRIHSERLRKFKHFSLQAYDSDSHNIVKDLRDKGQLIKIIRDQLN